MKHLSKVAAVALALLLPTALAWTGKAAAPAAPGAYRDRAVYRFVNGLWFDGRAFVPKTFYSVNGVLRAAHGGRVDREFDLKGRFVVPPFAEAHNHHFMEGMDYRAQIRDYLARGIFYAKNPNTIQKLTDPVRPSVNNPESVDVTFANGGLTATGGHPVQIYDFLARRGVIPGWTKEMMNGQAYFIIDSEADLEKSWPLIMAGKPDFIKTYLEHSEEYERRKDDPKFYGQRGLDPSLLRKIVARAHHERLRVSVHVNTATDFRAAVAAGADEIAHLPLERLTGADARAAARRRVVVVTTTLSHRPTSHVKDLDSVHRDNLRLLRRAGVPVVLGTDDNNRTVVEEAENVRRLRAFDDLTLLKLWVEETPRAIFPGRKIGRLADGQEASFIALDGNPVSDFANVRRVSFRFKQGHVIEPGGGRR